MEILSSLIKDDSKKISVIIPCYNCNSYINQTIDSVFNNDYGNLEVILVDDLGKERFQSVLKSKHLEKIKIIKNKENLGPGYSRINGLNNSNGKYIIFLDSDDILSRSSISKRIKIMEKNSLDFIRGGLAYLVNDKFTKGPFIKKNTIENNINKNYKDFEILWAPGCYIFTREVIESSKNYKESMNFRIGEDQLLVSSILNNTKKYGIIEDYVYFYRKNEESLMNSTWDNKKLYDFVFYQSHLFNNLKEMPKLYILQKHIRYNGKYFKEKINLINKIQDKNIKRELLEEINNIYSDFKHYSKKYTMACRKKLN